MSVFLTDVGVIVAHTPIWVWPLYTLLLYLGFRRTRESVVPVWRMLILPVVVALLAIASVIGAGASALPAALLGLALGVPAGWRLECDGTARRLPDGTLWLRGEWLSLVQIVLVLVVRYATNAVGAMNPLLHASPIWQLCALFICSALSGIFLGRTGRRLLLPPHSITTAT